MFHCSSIQKVYKYKIQNTKYKYKIQKVIIWHASYALQIKNTFVASRYSLASVLRMVYTITEEESET